LFDKTFSFGYFVFGGGYLSNKKEGRELPSRLEKLIRKSEKDLKKHFGGANAKWFKKQYRKEFIKAAAKLIFENFTDLAEEALKKTKAKFCKK
jgi:hypothetical protein